MRRRFESRFAGFSLVELMVAVSIVGILAVIAVPQYRRYEARSRKTEAKTSLLAAYTNLRAFSTETGSYTACLAAAGFKPEAGPKYYSVGFTAVPASGCGPTGTHSCLTSSWREVGGAMVPHQGCLAGAQSTYFPANTAVSGATVPVGPPGLGPCVSAVSKSAFRVIALAGLGFTHADVWSIDQERGLLNDQDAMNDSSAPCAAPPGGGNNQNQEE